MTQPEVLFARKLRALRKNVGLTQRALGEKIGYSEKAVSKWETGDYLPDIRILLALSEQFGVRMDDFFVPEGEVYFLGIDGGGTKTEYLLKDARGETVRRLITEGCNPFDIGKDAACQVLKKGIGEICLGIPYSCISVYAAIAGAGNPEYRKHFLEFLLRLGFLAVGADSDNTGIIEAGLQGKDGIALILGTGVCLFRVTGAEKVRLSGNGYLFDDGGSGFNFGRDAIHHYYSVLDGREKAGALYRAVAEKANCPPDAFLTKLYKEGKRTIASFSVCVFDTLETDEYSAAIFCRNLKEIVELIETAKRAMPSKVKVCLAGGMTKQAALVEAIRQSLDVDLYDVFVLQQAPVEGTVSLARKQWQASRDAEKLQ